MKRWLILGALAFAGGVAVSEVARAVPTDSPYAKLGIFARVLAHIENSYVEPVDRDRLMYGAVEGLVATLDPHTAFLTPQLYRNLKSDTNGEYPGVGIEIERIGGHLVVVSPIDGTPAARAGIRTGDRILKIDDAPTADMEYGEAFHRLRGTKGTRVRILVEREGWDEPREIALVRELIRIVAVEGRPLPDGLAYVRVKTFQEGVHRILDRTLDKLENESSGGLKGLVLDLRNNPGGLLDQAVRVVDLFLKEGLIVRTKGKNGRTLEEWRAHPRKTHRAFPIVAVVNGGTASASEIAAGALQDHRRAVILGTRTFGKGSVQNIIELEDGSALKLTVARYYTPAGRSIQGAGIRPDIIVEPRGPYRASAADGQREEDLKRHLRPEPDTREEPPHPTFGDDLQLRTAYEYLRSLDVLRASSTTGG